MTRKTRRFVSTLIVVALLVVIVFGAVKMLPTGGPRGPGQQPRESVGPAAAPVPPPEGPAGRGQETSDTQPVPPPPPPAATGSVPAGQDAQAVTLLERGLGELQAGNLLGARGLLSDALWTSRLDESRAEQVRGHLTGLADKTLLSRTIYPGDPCTLEYTVQRGDVLVNVERQLKLHVPAQLVLRINGIADAARIQPGQKLKMVRGPFHAVVNKGRFFMDVYLQEPDTGRMIFVRRFPVGTGQDGSTPPGRWRVAQGGKLRDAPWTPPTSSNLPRKRILPGQPGYALGRQGLWISLEGIEGNPYTTQDGYGIHDTRDQDSIGKAESLGCIRMKDGDIDLVFSLLYEVWSTVTVVE